MEICPLGNSLIHVDGRMYRRKDRELFVQRDERNEAKRRFTGPFERTKILYLWQKYVK
jgi:hypothetical protein